MQRLRIILRMISLIPKSFIFLVRLLISILRPGKQIPPRVYYSWVGSIVEETLGNIDRAIKYCTPFLQYSETHIIRYQYNQLIKKTKQML